MRDYDISGEIHALIPETTLGKLPGALERPFLAFDAAGNICYSNDAAQAELGYGTENLLHFRCFDISPDLNRGNWNEVLQPGKESEGNSYMRE